ncbi:MAG: response regulator receiver domain protein [Cyanobacteria bacterium RYN_339]|nr:response regulator receiver domain protein [Cyanobacteria bacterium RYN_339]
MIDFEFFEHNGTMATAEVTQEGNHFVAVWVNEPDVKVEGRDRADAIARLKQRMPGGSGATAPGRAIEAAPPKPVRTLRRLAQPGRVLVVDDNPAALQIAMLVCQLCGHAPVGARDGGEAWGHMQAGPVDLVLTDLHMPGVGGLALVRALRKMHPEVPILAVTAAGPNGVRALENLGVDGVVRKPFAVQQLAEAIRGLIIPA